MAGFGNIRSPSWSPDGTLIVFNSDRTTCSSSTPWT